MIHFSPWPTTPVAIQNATGALRFAIGSQTQRDPNGAADTDLENYENAAVQYRGMVAAARVERDAPGAPQAVKDEAVIRFAGYLHDARLFQTGTRSPFGTTKAETLGPHTVEHVTNHANAWRNSGAAGLLAPYKVRRAGKIG